MAAFGLGGFSGRFAQLFTGSWVKPADANQQKQDDRLQSQALQILDGNDGSQIIDTSHYHSPGMAIETSFQTSAQLVNEYRNMAMDPDVDMAIDDIINASITTDEEDPVIDLDLDNVDLSDSVKTKILSEWSHIIQMLDMEETGYEKFRQWYVDGRQYYQIVVDENKKSEGIKRLVLLDPRAIKKIKEVSRKLDPVSRVETIDKVESFYMYDQAWSVDNTGSGSPSSNANVTRASRQALRIPEEMIVFAHSGILSPDGDKVYGHLEKSKKPLNNLKMMRDALVIYRITRAPERRIFYVDVGSLPKKAAEEYVMSFMNKNKSKVAYDPQSGRVQGNAYQQTMLEDYWMPRREGGRGTEISTLEGGQNLGQIDDVLYFQKLLYRSLNVPVGRLENDNADILIGGRGAEVTRDEWKFNKFVQRLRRRYITLFKQILRTQLDLKGIATTKEWDETIETSIKFKFAADSYIKQQQEDESLLNRMGSLTQADGYVGKYFSKDWVRREILKQTDEEIKTEDLKMEEERKADLNNQVDGINATQPDVDEDGNPIYPIKKPFEPAATPPAADSSQ